MSRLIGAVAWAALTLYFFTPVRAVLDASLDASNYTSYAYFTAHGFEYGTEVVPMAGPYGFVMYGWIHGGDLFWSRVAGQLLLTGALAALTLWFFSRIRSLPLRWLWLAAHLAFTPFIEDLPVEWTLLLGGLFLLHPVGRLPALFAAALLAWLSLFKGTHLFLGLATITVVVMGLLLQWRPRRAVWVALGYGAGLSLAWMLAGQQPASLSAYVRGVFELAVGYAGAMSLPAPGHVVFRGAAVFILLLVGLAGAAWCHRRNARALAGLALFASYAFVNWKHGFIRADGHVYIFFHFTMVAALAAYAWAFHARDHDTTGRRDDGTMGPRDHGTTEEEDQGTAASREARALSPERAGLAFLLAILVVGAFGPGEPMRPRPIAALREIGPRWWERVQHLAHLPAAKAAIHQQLEAQREQQALPRTQRIVGERTIDFVGYEHGIIRLNRLNYRPRPMGGGSFNAYTPYLRELNRSHLADPARRPEFLLLKMQTIDDRLMSQDDGRSLLQLLHHYRPLFVEMGYVLLRADAAAASPIELRPLSRSSFGFGEAVPVPEVGPDEILLARLDLPPSLPGRIVAAVYKPATTWIELNGRDVQQATRRIVPSMVVTPFVLAPVIEDTPDFLQLFTRRPFKPLESFRLRSSAPWQFARPLTVEFFAAPRPSVQPDADIDDMIPFTRLRTATVEPGRTTTAEGTVVPTGRRDVELLHPPAAVRWKLTGNERELLFEYGLAPKAYLEGTNGNGVEFIVALLPPGGPPMELFRRLLDPIHVPLHRGNHAARVLLPAFKPGSRLELRTEPGEFGDTAWDWSYITRHEFRSGPLRLDQFPTFNRAPSAIEADVIPALDFEGGKVILLHAPGSMTFDLTGEEQELNFDFGLLPGAYTDGGGSDGVDVLVELERQGKPREEIFRRALRPHVEPRDQGRHWAKVPIPSVDPGDRLIVRIDPGAAGEMGWDWSYLARLQIE